MYSGLELAWAKMETFVKVPGIFRSTRVDEVELATMKSIEITARASYALA